MDLCQLCFYFSLTTIALIRVVSSSSFTPLLLFLLFTRRITVFIFFCGLLFSSKTQFYKPGLIKFLLIPLLIRKKKDKYERSQLWSMGKDLSVIENHTIKLLHQA